MLPASPKQMTELICGSSPFENHGKVMLNDAGCTGSLQENCSRTAWHGVFVSHKARRPGGHKFESFLRAK